MNEPLASGGTPLPHTLYPARRLQRLFLFALLGIAATTFLGQIIIHRSAAVDAFDGRVIHLASRQCWHSQGLGQLALAVQAAPPDARPALAKELAELLAHWKQGHETLQRGDRESGLRPLNDES